MEEKGREVDVYYPPIMDGQMLGLIQVSNVSMGLKNLHALNGVLVGEAVMDVDGFWYFWPRTSGNGHWSQEILQAIASTLFELNREWQNQIDNDPKISEGASRDPSSEL